MDLEYFDGEARKRQRRNLVLTCAWMILFLLGGIGFREAGTESITPIFPFAIKNERIVEGGMWVLLLYFWLRYFQYSKLERSKFRDTLGNAVFEYKRMRNIAIKAALKEFPGEENSSTLHSIKRLLFRRILVLSKKNNVAGQPDIHLEAKLPLWPTIFCELIVGLRFNLTDAEFLEFMAPHRFALVTILIGVIEYKM